MLFLANLLLIGLITIVITDPTRNNDTLPTSANETSKPTRRILRGRVVGDTRPYMVYLRAATGSDPKTQESDWLCGGVIIHEQYILTSAACIEDVKQFYVISGTNKWSPFKDKDNECVKNSQNKAVWKCVPKSYYFDGDNFDNIRWIIGDIAVVKVEEPFNFQRRVRGCDFIPKKVAFNNRSADFQKPRTFGSIAGWGSNENFGDGFSKTSKEASRSTTNSAELMESDVQLISNKNCRKQWEPRYHFVIDERIICTRDVGEDEATVCTDQDGICKELQYTDEEYDDEEPVTVVDNPEQVETKRRMMVDPTQLVIHTADHFHNTRRTQKAGGFCENDHGGPLIVGQGKTSMVVGIMSACRTRDITRKCYGPFLYTSVYHHRHLISCAINKDSGPLCRQVLRSSRTPMVETVFDWSNHIDGAAKAHVIGREGNNKKKEEEKKVNTVKKKATHTSNIFENPIKTKSS